MVTNTRQFLRDFATFKAKARAGQMIRVQDKEGEFLFTVVAARKSLLGVAKGKITFHADITAPTLTEGDWRPSL
jgi:hypothetical protein